MTITTIPEPLIIALLLFAVGFVALLFILALKIPALGHALLKSARQTIALFRRRGRKPIVDPKRQERTARRIDGDVLYFD